MSNTIVALSIDAGDAAALAGFWAQALGWQVAPGSDEQRAVVTTDEAAMPVARLIFHRVPEGKTVKNRLHLDLAAADWEAEVGRLTDLGATRIRDVQENGARWFTLADPEGNEFDLVRR